MPVETARRGHRKRKQNARDKTANEFIIKTKAAMVSQNTACRSTCSLGKSCWHHKKRKTGYIRISGYLLHPDRPKSNHRGLQHLAPGFSTAPRYSQPFRSDISVEKGEFMRPFSAHTGLFLVASLPVLRPRTPSAAAS